MLAGVAGAVVVGAAGGTPASAVPVDPPTGGAAPVVVEREPLVVRGSYGAPAPLVDRIVCRVSCAEAGAARPGAVVRVVGKRTQHVAEVLFLAGPGGSDDTSAAPRRVTPRAVSVRVPRTAASGPVALALADGTRSAPSRSVLVVDASDPVAPAGAIDAEVQGQKVFFDAHRPAELAYVLGGTEPATVNVTLVRAADDVVIQRWTETGVVPGIPRTLTWDGMAGGHVQRDGVYRFRVEATPAPTAAGSVPAAPGAAGSVPAAPGAAGSVPAAPGAAGSVPAAPGAAGDAPAAPGDIAAGDGGGTATITSGTDGGGGGAGVANAANAGGANSSAASPGAGGSSAANAGGANSSAASSGAGGSSAANVARGSSAANAAGGLGAANSGAGGSGAANAGGAADGGDPPGTGTGGGAPTDDPSAPDPGGGGVPGAVEVPGVGGTVVSDGESGSFTFQRHRFPIVGAHTFGTGAAAFGGGRGHQGQDVFAECGTPIVAARGGRVKVKQYEGRAGNYLVVDGADTGVDFAYMHLRDEALVAEGDRVRTGELIGYVGDTGRADGCHLHFEMWTGPGWYAGGAAFDPLPQLQEWDAES